MTELTGIPLSGQGKSLPSDFPYKGEWLLENRIFLFRPTDPGTIEGTGPEMTALLSYGKPDWCFGINAMQLAFALGVTGEEVFSHNHAHTLVLVRADDVTPTRGGTRAKRYIFQIGDRQERMGFRVVGREAHERGAGGSLELSDGMAEAAGDSTRPGSSRFASSRLAI